MKAIRTWSEISYGLSETKRGASPKTRRFYKSRLNKVRREMDKQAIVEGLPNPARQWGEWDSDFIDDPCMKDQEVAYLWAEWRRLNSVDLTNLIKDIQLEEMWNSHTL